METPTISVIIPIHNVAPYLPKCLDSVIAQTYNNLEIILIDDGSTDGSTTIAKSYAQKDPRIIYHHQKNSGVSSARNQGLKLSASPLITFIDPDDSIHLTLIAQLYKNLTHHSADIASITHRRHATVTATLCTQAAIKQLFLEQNISFHLWAKLYKRSLWDDISFPVGHIYEDVAVQVRIFSKAHKIHLTHKPLYRYRRRTGSFVASPHRSQFTDLFHYANQNLKFTQESYPALVPYAERYIFAATRHTIQDLIRAKSLTETDKKTYLRHLKTYAPTILRLKEAPLPEKLIALLSIVHRNLPLPLLSYQAKKSQPPTYQ